MQRISSEKAYSTHTSHRLRFLTSRQVSCPHVCGHVLTTLIHWTLGSTVDDFILERLACHT